MGELIKVDGTEAPSPRLRARLAHHYRSAGRFAALYPEVERGRARIVRKDIPLGISLLCYDATGGRFFKAKADAPWPNVVLQERSGQGWRTWMSLGPDEWEGLRIPVRLARGRVLTSGLGLGLFVRLALGKRSVTTVEVVEQSQAVIELVGPMLNDHRVSIHRGNVKGFLRRTQQAYDFIYLDIWPDIIGPLEEADEVAELAKGRLAPGGQVRVWLQELLDRVKAKLPRSPVDSIGFGSLPPCLVCGKTFRHDYAGLCMDCADSLGVSSLFANDYVVGDVLVCPEQELD